MTSPGMIDAAGLVKAVKPLEFEHGAADAAGGVYEVASYGKYWAVYLNQNLVAESKSEEAAYAAAQADYAQRIASALNPSLLELASCYVMCNQCAARGPDSTQEGDNEDTPGGHAAILAWNRRPARSARTCSSPTHGLTT